jgi:surfactin synthase thioesterase subunit/glycosyltransferase involved in cell wall biosynthesis
MKILLTSNASHIPPRGGATRSNLLWLQHLAEHGHACRVVGGALPDTERGKSEQLRDEGMAAEVTAMRDGIETAVHEGVTIYSVADPPRRVQLLREQIRDFQPDWVLVSSEDLGQLLLREAQQSAPGRVVYVAHTPQWFPFGPASWNPDARATELVGRCAGVVAIGRHMAEYIRRYTGRMPAVIHPPIYGDGPFPNLAAFDDGLVTMINPCAVKGLSIFLDVARALPHVKFGALPGWGTTAADRAALAALPNIEILPNCRDIEDFLQRTRILLMPSLWYEGFGLIVMEAMLRGIPVIASDSGGLQEAKEGTRFVIPVQGIERYSPVFDEHGMPKPVIAEQSVQPWIEAVQELLSDRTLFEAESTVSREVARRFVGGLNAGKMEEFLEALPRQTPLRILLAQNSPYFPAHGGGDKSNRLLVEALAARGHACRVVARTGGFGAQEHERYLKDLAARDVTVDSADEGIVRFRLNAVEAHVITAHANLRGYFSEQLREFAPDVILTSTDDPAQLLLETALKSERVRVVYLARATMALPFGPDCAFPSEQKTEVLRQADRVVGVSNYVADYIRQWGGMDAVHVPISLMDQGPAAELGRFDNEFVTLVNPCAVKGISIFLGLAERMPHVQFAAVPTWGTNESDRAMLEGHANVHVIEPVDRIDDLLKRTRVLLVPSLWAEARSRIVVEAMLRGVPVIGSKTGGIPEAMMGVDYLLPVRPIEKYRPRVDEQMVPVAEVPEQDLGPWQAALETLVSDRERYEQLSRESRNAALQYLEKLTGGPFEQLLEDAVRAPRRNRMELAFAAGGKQSALDSLSPEKRRLLALRLKKKTESAPQGLWFPHAAMEKPAQLRLFCLPHAGGGMATFHGWNEALGASVAVCPVRLPGRESRAAEASFRRMDELVAALATALAAHSERPFAFFGHSMGAVIGFELARLLRREGRQMPLALFVSGARAPQYRRGHVPPPDPSEEEFLAELDRLEGMPKEVLENRELMRLILPALQADAALYRSYVYSEEAPLACPIRAYGGSKDPNISPEHLEGWGQQTAGSFGVHLFTGGHFFLQSAQEAFLKVLTADVAEVCR